MVTERRRVQIVGSVALATALIVLLVLYRQLDRKTPQDGPARVFRQAAQQWQAAEVHPNDCPTYADIFTSHLLDAENARAYPESTIQINCIGGDVIVRWAGRDGRFGTDDDGVAPKAAVAHP